MSRIEPQHADEEAAAVMLRELIRAAGETLGLELPECYVTAVEWDLSGYVDGRHNLFRVDHGIDSDVVARIADVVRNGQASRE